MGDIRKLLNPATIALIGASEVKDAAGRTTLENLLASKGITVFPVNPNRKTVLDLPCYPSINSVPAPVDLAVIVTPANTVPRIVEECGKSKVEGIVILSAGFGEDGEEGKKLEREIVAIRKKYRMRMIGPNSLGVIRPNVNLNVSFLKSGPEKGKVAFISQSGAFGRALLDWGISAHIGFSMFVSLGSMIDVEFGDLIDFLGTDPHTRSIMLYVEESLGDVKRFISAAKGFACSKPIIVLKPQMPAEQSEPFLSHTGALAGNEEVYDAVFRRIGAVRVRDAADLLNAASALYARYLPRGRRLLIITNAAGVGNMAKSKLGEWGGHLAKLSDKSLEALGKLLPSYWNRANPVYIERDADVMRFASTLSICLEDSGADSVLVIYTPQGVAQSDELAKAIVCVAESATKPVLATFMGGKGVELGKEILLQNNIPTYDTPEEAVRTYLYMHRYERSLELLYQTPEELPVDQAPPKNNLKALIRKAVKEGTRIFTEEESRRFLTNYGIPVLKSETTRTVEDALQTAKEIGYPVVLKISSPDIIYRVDTGGVIAGIRSEQELKEAYEKLPQRVAEWMPAARITGITVQKMIEKIDYEVILGAKRDKTFGSVILFGMGGVGVEVFKDFSVGLPPLNQTLARRLMEETRVYKSLQGYRNRPPADLRQLEQIVVSFSNLIVDFPEIQEMDINPIAISNGRPYALDARIVIDASMLDHAQPYPHLVITPYPTRYATPWTLPDGTAVLIRPMKPEDEPLINEMLSSASEETVRMRYFQAIKQTTHDMHIRLCSMDYDREFRVAAELREGEKRKIIGTARLVTEPATKSAEYAVIVADPYHGKGLGYKLVDVLIGIAHDKGLEEVYGLVQTKNRRMLGVCRKLGFTIGPPQEELCRVTLSLT